MAISDSGGFIYLPDLLAQVGSIFLTFYFALLSYTGHYGFVEKADVMI